MAKPKGLIDSKYYLWNQLSDYNKNAQTLSGNRIQWKYINIQRRIIKGRFALEHTFDIISKQNIEAIDLKRRAETLFNMRTTSLLSRNNKPIYIDAGS